MSFKNHRYRMTIQVPNLNAAGIVTSRQASAIMAEGDAFGRFTDHLPLIEKGMAGIQLPQSNGLVPAKGRQSSSIAAALNVNDGLIVSAWRAKKGFPPFHMPQANGPSVIPADQNTTAMETEDHSSADQAHRPISVPWPAGGRQRPAAN
jgi:hypothetical protein